MRYSPIKSRTVSPWVAVKPANRRHRTEVLLPIPTNSEVAKILREIRTLMEFAGKPYYEVMAYERAATAVENAAPSGSWRRPAN